MESLTFSLLSDDDLRRCSDSIMGDTVYLRRV